VDGEGYFFGAGENANPTFLPRAPLPKREREREKKREEKKYTLNPISRPCGIRYHAESYARVSFFYERRRRPLAIVRAIVPVLRKTTKYRILKGRGKGRAVVGDAARAAAGGSKSAMAK
jgi:hypothetical protein